MRTKIIIETPEELCHLFAHVRRQGDTFPYVGSDDVFLEVLFESGHLYLKFSGSDRDKYGIDFPEIDQHKQALEMMFERAGIKWLIIP